MFQSDWCGCTVGRGYQVVPVWEGKQRFNPRRCSSRAKKYRPRQHFLYSPSHRSSIHSGLTEKGTSGCIQWAEEAHQNQRWPRAGRATEVSGVRTIAGRAISSDIARVHYKDPSERFLNLTGPSNAVEFSRVQMAFKPVDRKRICRSASEAFSVSLAAPKAAAHAVVNGSNLLRIMVVLVILPLSPWDQEKLKNTNRCHEVVITLDRSDLCLPLAELSVL